MAASEPYLLVMCDPQPRLDWRPSEGAHEDLEAALKANERRVDVRLQMRELMEALDAEADKDRQ